MIRANDSSRLAFDGLSFVAATFKAATLRNSRTVSGQTRQIKTNAQSPVTMNALMRFALSALAVIELDLFSIFSIAIVDEKMSALHPLARAITPLDYSTRLFSDLESVCDDYRD